MPRHDDTENHDHERAQFPPKKDEHGNWVRTVGRRGVDFVHQKGWWALLIGVLMQGGFLLMNKSLLEMGERQMERQFLMQQTQHTEVVVAMAAQTAAVSHLTEKIGEVLDRLEKNEQAGRGGRR